MDDGLIEHVAALIYNCNHAHGDWEGVKKVSEEVDAKHPDTGLQREYRRILERNRRCAGEIIALMGSS